MGYPVCDEETIVATIGVLQKEGILRMYPGLRLLLSHRKRNQTEFLYICVRTYERTDRPRGEFFHTIW